MSESGGGRGQKKFMGGGGSTISDVMLPDTLISEIIAGRNFSGSKKTANFRELICVVCKQSV